MFRQKCFWRRLIYNTIYCVTLITFMACSLKTFPDYIQPPAIIPNHQVKNNVTLACEPFIEKEKLINLFGIDLLNEYAEDEPGYVILPIYVSIENMGSDLVSIQYRTIQFISREGKVIANAVDGDEAGRPCQRSIEHREPIERISNDLAFFGLFSPALLLAASAPAPFMENAKATDRSAYLSMRSKYLGNKSIANGQKHGGFVYFLLKKEQVAALENAAVLHMNVKNLETEEEIPFSFGMSLNVLSNRLTKMHIAE